MTTPDPLPMWTVYDHPKDFPDCFVARLFHVTAQGAVATDTTLCDRNLETLREQLGRGGLVRLLRDPNDDPKIVEVWL